MPEAKTAYTILVSTWRGDVRNDLASVLRALAITISSALLLALVGGRATAACCVRHCSSCSIMRASTPLPGGWVQVDSTITSATRTLRLSDSGIGVPEWARECIFERFYRVDKYRSRPGAENGGAGLGLPIARWIAELHGGTVYLESSTAQGSTFVIKLPRAPEASALEVDSEVLNSSEVS